MSLLKYNSQLPYSVGFMAGVLKCFSKKSYSEKYFYYSNLCFAFI